MVLIKAVHAVSDFIDKVCSAACIVILTAMVLVTGAQIIWRLCFTALTWSEELTRYLLIWATFLGAGIVYKHNGHIAVTLLQSKCPPAARKVLQLAVHLLCGAFCVIAAYFGFQYMKMQGNQLSAALRIPMRYMYLSVPIGCLVIALHVVDAVAGLLVPGEKKEGNP